MAVFKKTAAFVIPNSGGSSSEKAVAENEDTAIAQSSESKEEETTTTEDTATTGDKRGLDTTTEDEPLESVKRPRMGMTRAERYGAPIVKEEPFLFLDAENSDVALFSKFYGLDEDFPKDQFLVRSEGEKNKTIYFVSEAVKSILQSEDIHRLKVP